jgi:DNA-binding PadR family transcriptional regulator
MNYMQKPGIWEISVLALLREMPMHPYEMQRLLRLRHKEEILDLKRGSLYHAIHRLTAAGLIAVKTTGRDGRRPERTTYKITPSGLNAFVETLRRIVATPRHESSEFMAATSFLIHLDPKEAIIHLEQRARSLQAEIRNRGTGLAAASSHVLRINLIESEYLLVMLKAELAWVEQIKKEIQTGKLTWDLQAIFRDLQISRKNLSGKKSGRKDKR